MTMQVRTARQAPVAVASILRAAGDDRRGLYLDIACELAGGEGSAPAHHLAVSHVTLAAVAERAGVSRGVLYRLWSSQQDFWSDLAEFLLVPGAHHVGPVGSSSGADIDVAQDVLLTDPLPLLRTAVVAYPGTSRTRRLVGEQRRVVLERLEAQVRQRIDAIGRRCLPGLTTADLAIALTVVGNGLPTTGRMAHSHDLTFDTSAFLTDDGSARSLLGVAFDAIVGHLTEPLDAASAHGPLAPTSAEPPAMDTSELDRWSNGQRRYLSIALELAVAPDEGELHHRVLGHVTLDAVARHAGVTRRTLTNLWPSQSDFRLDLFAHLLDRDRSAVEAIIGESATAVAGCSDGHDAFRLLGDRLQRHVVDTAFRPTHLAFAPQLDRGPLAAVATDRSDRHVATCGHALRSLLRAGRRRLRAGVTWRQATLAMLTIVDGSARLERTDPGLAVRATNTPYGVHTITGLTIDALLSTLTEPVPRRSRASTFAAMLG